MKQAGTNPPQPGANAPEVVLEPFRPELMAHCYRMLGSHDDAEDAVQDVMIRAWRGLAGFAGRSSLRTWLYTIATNVCLTRLERRSRRALPIDLGPPSNPDRSAWVTVEQALLEPFPDVALEVASGPHDPAVRYEARESVELAFVAAFQHLVPNQRAVLILRDVVGFSAKETALALSTTVASVTSALQRARRTVDDHRPSASQQAVLRSIGDVEHRRRVDCYVEAWERGDVADIVAMLTDDVTFSMPPYSVWYEGRDAVAAFLPVGPLRERWRLRQVGANGQLAFGCYAWSEQRGCFEAHSLDVLTLRGCRICHITGFLGFDGTAFRRFGLPPTVGR